MKKNITTLLGLIIFTGTVVITFLDMYLSTKEVYTFVLEGWHIFAGLGLGIGLIILHIFCVI